MAYAYGLSVKDQFNLHFIFNEFNNRYSLGGGGKSDILKTMQGSHLSAVHLTTTFGVA